MEGSKKGENGQVSPTTIDEMWSDTSLYWTLTHWNLLSSSLWNVPFFQSQWNELRWDLCNKERNFMLHVNSLQLFFFTWFWDSSNWEHRWLGVQFWTWEKTNSTCTKWVVRAILMHSVNCNLGDIWIKKLGLLSW